MISIFMKTEMELYIVARLSGIRLDQYPRRGSGLETRERTGGRTQFTLRVYSVFNSWKE
jgi:hypothetical protein